MLYREFVMGRQTLRESLFAVVRKIARRAVAAGAAAATPFLKKRVIREFASRPQSFGVESTNVCNADCSFCAYGKGYDARPKEHVQDETLRHSLQLFDQAGGGTFSFAALLGDPLVQRDLLPKIRLARSYSNISGVSISTNGLALHGFDTDALLDSGLTHMSISTCIGSPTAYRRLYGRDHYERMRDNIVNILDRNGERGHPISIHLMLRVDRPLSALYQSEDYRRIGSLLGSKDAISILDEDWDDWNGMIKASDLPRGQSFKPVARDMSSPCYAVYRKLQVMTNGDIQHCSCRPSPDLVVDNILNYTSLEAYWRGPRLRDVRDKWSRGEIPTVCRTCSHYKPVEDLVERTVRFRVNMRVAEWAKSGRHQLRRFRFRQAD